MSNLTYPEDFADWQRSNPIPKEQVAYFNIHPETRMPYRQWDTFYCVTTEHKGFHCGSCLSDEEYFGMANFDDKCCCLSKTTDHRSEDE